MSTITFCFWWEWVRVSSFKQFKHIASTTIANAIAIATSSNNLPTTRTTSATQSSSTVIIINTTLSTATGTSAVVYIRLTTVHFFVFIIIVFIVIIFVIVDSTNIIDNCCSGWIQINTGSGSSICDDCYAITSSSVKSLLLIPCELCL